MMFISGDVAMDVEMPGGRGDFLDFDLAAGQTLLVDTGCMVMVEPTVRYEVKMQGGIKKSIFGGEGLFLVHMTGPGHVTLQTLPFSRTAERVMEAAGGGQGEKGGMLGRLLEGGQRRREMGLLDRVKAGAQEAAQRAKDEAQGMKLKPDLSSGAS